MPAVICWSASQVQSSPGATSRTSRKQRAMEELVALCVQERQCSPVRDGTAGKGALSTPPVLSFRQGPTPPTTSGQARSPTPTLCKQRSSVPSSLKNPLNFKESEFQSVDHPFLFLRRRKLEAIVYYSCLGRTPNKVDALLKREIVVCVSNRKCQEGRDGEALSYLASLSPRSGARAYGGQQ